MAPRTQLQGVIRSCIGCRKRSAPSQLIRLVLQDGEVVCDLVRRQPGRGAYLCPKVACLDGAIKRRSLPRALRGPVRAEREVLRACFAQAFQDAQDALQATRRRAESTDDRLEWLSEGLREFTLRIPGAMNRGPASEGQPLAQTSTPSGVVGAHE